MKKRFLSILLLLSLLFATTACTKEAAQPQTTEPTTEMPTEPPAPDAKELFSEAVEKLLSADALTVSIEATEKHKVWDEVFIQRVKSEMIATGLNGDLRCKVDTSLEFNDDPDFEMTEIYADGHCYATFDGAKYHAETDSEKFLAGHYPVALFDCESFAEGTVQETADGILLTFTETNALEEWVAPDHAVLSSAQATALLGEDGVEQMSYTASFRQGAADIVLEVETELKQAQVSDLDAEIPEDTKDYADISDVTLPAAIERVRSNLAHSESRSATISQIVSSQAAGAAVINSETVSEYKMNRDYAALVETNVTIYSSDGEESYEAKDLYRDGTYTYTLDGEEQSQEVSRSLMMDWIKSVFTEYLMEGAFLTDSEVTDYGDGMLIEFCSEDETFGIQLKDLTMYELFSGSTTLDDMATAYKTKEVKGYYGIDKDTWLPTSYSVDFSGAHTIEGQDYLITQQVYADLTPADPNAYESITEEKLPEEKPENPATPLFYHVTGEDGSQMWLLGTIHVGDERTAFLPQEIYDAFEASDALAVEFDINKYVEDLENNEDYQSSIAEMYFYSDGTSVKDHLDSEVYEEAVKMMKYTGNYHSTMEMIKGSIWESILSNAKLGAGRRLSSEKGVDQRLLDLAGEKEILDVESAEKQIGMLTGFSDDLQQILLEGTMEVSAHEYSEGVLELYELWCSGDEAALREYLNNEEEDIEELSEEEKALYEEYEKAMSTDRDIDMIEVAKGYMSSGKTVFYAVGLAHLLKENGLVDGLREAGYQVELVTFAPQS